MTGPICIGGGAGIFSVAPVRYDNNDDIAIAFKENR